jgi:hypothetical protein
MWHRSKNPPGFSRGECQIGYTRIDAVKTGKSAVINLNDVFAARSERHINRTKWDK